MMVKIPKGESLMRHHPQGGTASGVDERRGPRRRVFLLSIGSSIMDLFATVMHGFATADEGVAWATCHGKTLAQIGPNRPKFKMVNDRNKDLHYVCNDLKPQPLRPEPPSPPMYAKQQKSCTKFCTFFLNVGISRSVEKPSMSAFFKPNSSF